MMKLRIYKIYITNKSAAKFKAFYFQEFTKQFVSWHLIPIFSSIPVIFIIYRVDQKSWRVRKKCTVASKLYF